MFITFSALVKVMHEMQVFCYFSYTPGSQGASHWGPQRGGHEKPKTEDITHEISKGPTVCTQG